MKYKLSLVLLVFSILGCKHDNQNMDNKLITDFYNLYEKDSAEASLNFLFSSNKWMQSSDSTMIRLKSQLGHDSELLGKYYGYEQITVKKFGKDYVLYSYLTKYEIQPLRFTFVLYRVNDRWQVQNFKYDMDFDKELEKAAEAVFIKDNY